MFFYYLLSYHLMLLILFASDGNFRRNCQFNIAIYVVYETLPIEERSQTGILIKTVLLLIFYL